VELTKACQEGGVFYSGLLSYEKTDTRKRNKGRNQKRKNHLGVGRGGGEIPHKVTAVGHRRTPQTTEGLMVGTNFRRRGEGRRTVV